MRFYVFVKIPTETIELFIWYAIGTYVSALIT